MASNVAVKQWFDVLIKVRDTDSKRCHNYFCQFSVYSEKEAQLKGIGFAQTLDGCELLSMQVIESSNPPKTEAQPEPEPVTPVLALPAPEPKEETKESDDKEQLAKVARSFVLVPITIEPTCYVLGQEAVAI